MMSTTVAKLVALLALAAISASHAAPATETPASCIGKIESSGLLAELTIPKEVGDFVADLRLRAPPQLMNFSLVKFADSSLVPELPAPTPDSLVQACVDYAGSTLTKLEAVCDLGQFVEDYNLYSDYLAETEKHPEFDSKIGHAKACLLI